MASSEIAIGRLERLEQVVDQDRDVFATLAERRNVDVNDAQPVEQVLAELALGDALGKVAVRRRDDADVRVPRGAVRADRLDFSRLQEAEEERLHAQAHLAHFVEKEGPAVRELQLARLVAIRPGEAAFDVAEELRLEERLGQSGTVHSDEGAVRAGRVHVDGPRDQILSDAALARHENLGLSHRGPPGHGQHFEHGGTCRNDVRLPAGHFVVAAFRMIAFRDVQHDTGSLCGPGALPPAICRASGAPALPVD